MNNPARQSRVSSGSDKADPRYLADISARRVHDLHYEVPDCQVFDVEIEHRLFFSDLNDAHNAGFKACEHCIG